MSKFERYKKGDEPYIYPHKHCKKCGEMIDEGLTYCPQCYEKIQKKKDKESFWKRIFKRNK